MVWLALILWTGYDFCIGVPTSHLLTLFRHLFKSSALSMIVKSSQSFVSSSIINRNNSEVSTKRSPRLGSALIILTAKLSLVLRRQSFRFQPFIAAIISLVLMIMGTQRRGVRAGNKCPQRFHNHREGPYYGLHLLALSHFKNLLRHYAKQTCKHGK